MQKEASNWHSMQEEKARFMQKEASNWHSIQDNDIAKHVDTGTPVTEENFHAWNDKFLEDWRRQKQEALAKEDKDKADRLTGRQFFELSSWKQAEAVAAALDNVAGGGGADEAEVEEAEGAFDEDLFS